MAKRLGVTQMGLKGDLVQRVGEAIKTSVYGVTSVGSAGSAAAASAAATTASPARGTGKAKSKATPLDRGEPCTDPNCRHPFVVEGNSGSARWAKCADCQARLRYQPDREGLWVKDGWDPATSQTTPMKENAARRRTHFTGISEQARN